MVLGFDMYVLQGYKAYSWYFVLEVRMTLRPQREGKLVSKFQFNQLSLPTVYRLRRHQHHLFLDLHLPTAGATMLPDLSSLRINGKATHRTATHRTTNAAGQPIPEDLEDTRDSRYMRKLQEYAKSLPYSIEPYSKIIEILDFILLRLTQSIEAKDYDIGFMQWDSMLT